MPYHKKKKMGHGGKVKKKMGGGMVNKNKMVDQLGSDDMAQKIATKINEKIDIPFVSEEKEQIFFEKCVDIVTDLLEGIIKGK
jgi:hypothetical protein